MMHGSSYLTLAARGLNALLFNRQQPFIGSIILTDRCNLACRHCTVNNITRTIYPLAQIQADLQALFDQGIRILFFYGGEPFLWTDQGLGLRDLVLAARNMGFILINVVTNGTISLQLPEADLILVSLDGSRENHNAIRGDTYDRILDNIRAAATDNIALYMAINRINQGDIAAVCQTARQLPPVRAVSFNLHTPYPGTEYLTLSPAERQACCRQIARLLDQGCPILNLKSALPAIASQTVRTPCRQCVIRENGRQWTCGRCLDVPGLCQSCGFIFPAELSLAFSGHGLVLLDMLKTYIRFIRQARRRR